MKVKVYKRKSDHPADDLLRGISKSTDLVRVQQSDYEEPLDITLDFEDRIICGAEEILSNRNKVLGIIDIELFWKAGKYYSLEPGDLVETEFGMYMKHYDGYVLAEIKIEK